VREYGKSEPAKIDDYFMLKSCTKPMTGYLAARIVDLGRPIASGSSRKFDWTTTILDVFPELESVTNAAYTKTTVAALMSHTSGMPYQPLTESGDEFLSISKDLRERRFQYVKAAVQDPPVSPSPYGGGSIIVAAMLERIMDRSWEQLMQTYVYDELGMTNSGVGENPYPRSTRGTSSHTQGTNGPEVWAPPGTYEQEPHAPAGRNPHASILDFARFAAAQLPNVEGRAGGVSKKTLLASQQLVPGSDKAAQGGWVVDTSSWDGTTPYLWHNGSDGHDYALINAYPTQDFATVAMTNYQVESSVNAVTDELHGIQQFYDMATAFDADAAAPKTATASDVYLSSEQYDASKAVDGSLGTRWATNNGVATATLTIDLGKSRSVSQIRIGEWGDRVRGFSVQCSHAGKDGGDVWDEVATGTTIGPNEVVTFDAVETTSVRLDITASTGSPTIAEVWVR
jgi:CubicO group peptidase (beta-lactamase class C family)